VDLAGETERFYESKEEIIRQENMVKLRLMSKEQLLEELAIQSLHFDKACEIICDEMSYKLPHQQAESFWKGDYCGRCGDKSRSYEGGKCSCDYFLENLRGTVNDIASVLAEKLRRPEHEIVVGDMIVPLIVERENRIASYNSRKADSEYLSVSSDSS
jgi:hypothetical protein